MNPLWNMLECLILGAINFVCRYWIWIVVILAVATAGSIINWLIDKGDRQ